MNSLAPEVVTSASKFMPFKFHDRDGKLLFEHVRFMPEDGKRIIYYRWNPVAYWGGGSPKREHWVNQKPEKHRGDPFDADHYLYRLPEVLRAVSAGEPVWWAEGERDADALRRAGVCGTSHHGGAGKVCVEQCAWLADARQIVLCLDRDRPGAYDGWQRYLGLTERVGVDPARIRIRWTDKGKDVRDHIALGYPLTALRRLTPEKLRAAASKYNPNSARRAGYFYFSRSI